MKAFCIVLGAMVLVLGGRDGRVESRAVRNEVGDSSSDDTYPFIDGLRMSSEHPPIDTGDLEEVDTDSNRFTGGFGKIRRIPISNEGGSGFEDQNAEFPFKNGLRKNFFNREKFRRIFKNEKLGNDGGFPFIPGVLVRNKTESQEELDVDDFEKTIPEGTEIDDFEKNTEDYPFVNGLQKLGSDGEFPFIPGVLFHNKTKIQEASEVDDFEKSPEEYSFINGLRKIGSDGDFPFIPGVLRRNKTKPQEASKVEDFEKSREEYPFVNGLRKLGSDGEFPFIPGVLSRNKTKIQEASEVDDFEKSPEEYRFVNGLQKLGSDGDFPFIPGVLGFNKTKPQEPELDDEYPFLNGLRKLPRSANPAHGAKKDDFEGQNEEFKQRGNFEKFESIFGDEKLGNNGDFPFIPGVHRRNKTKPQEPEADDFEKTREEYPFINGLRRLPRSANPDDGTKIDDDSVQFSNAVRLCASGKFFPFVECLHLNRNRSQQVDKPDEDEYPFINGLLDQIPSVEDIFKNNHPIKKRSTETKPDQNSNQTNQDDLNKITKQDRFNIEFGQTEEGETLLLGKIFPKMLNWYSKREDPDVMKTPVLFPNPNPYAPADYPKTNSCNITNIVVKNARVIGDLREETAAIVEGGIHQTHVKLYIISNHTFLDEYLVGIYGICPPKKKEEEPPAEEKTVLRAIFDFLFKP